MIDHIMSEYKAVILDLDGTVVKPEPEAMPSDEVVAAVQEAKDQGKKVSLATGRPLWMAQKIIERLGIIEYCVVNGGSELHDAEGKRPPIIEPLDPRSQDKAIRLIQSMGLPVYDSDNQYGGKPIHPVLNEPVPSNSKLFVSAIDALTAEKLARQLKQKVKQVAPHISTSWSKGSVVDVHITSSSATKAEAVATLIDVLDVHPSQVVGVGDNHNDRPMFSEVGLSVAMGNAPDEVKAAADVVAPPLEEDGVAWVIRNFVLREAGVRVESVRL